MPGTGQSKSSFFLPSNVLSSLKISIQLKITIQSTFYFVIDRSQLQT